MAEMPSSSSSNSWSPGSPQSPGSPVLPDAAAAYQPGPARQRLRPARPHWSLFPSLVASSPTEAMNILKSSDRRTPMTLKMSSIFHPTIVRSEANQQADSAEPPTVPYYRHAVSRKRPDSAASGSHSIKSEGSVRAEEQNPPPPAAKTVAEVPRKTITFLPTQPSDPDSKPQQPAPQTVNNKKVKKERRISGDKHSIMDSRVQSPISAPRSQPDSRENSEHSYETNATSLPALQSKGPLDDNDQLEPLAEEDLDPGSFDLVAPPDSGVKQYSLETRSEQLFSTEHLKVIFADPSLLLRFTAFLSSSRTGSIPILIYYLDAIKALKAIQYSNAIAEALDPIDGYDFTKQHLKSTYNIVLEDRAKKAFEVLVRDDLPAFITHTYIQTVSLSIQRRITGTLPPHLREASEGLAEVFCLTDPSRPDNPIVFASEEFHRTTQYGMNYVIGRNCRFLQGPKTNPFSVKRLRDKIDAGEEHCEVFLNYRRDGSPFMNLLMCAPLCDSRGTIRYFIGAQVDVSGLVKECSDLESLERVVLAADQRAQGRNEDDIAESEGKKDEFQELSEMLNMQELDTVRRWGGRMHKESQEETSEPSYNSGNWHKPRLLIHDASPDGTKSFSIGREPSGKLSGIYENYLLVRPYPSLRILFASPSLRVPGILQSPFMAKIGGSNRVRDELSNAFADGRGVTAKVRWVTKQDMEGRNRWIHCTPLIGSNGAIGVWMIVIVDDEHSLSAGKRFKQAPPVDPKFGRDKTGQHPNQFDDGGSLRSFAINNGGREGSITAYAPSEHETDGRGSPYSLRIGDM